MKRPSANVDYFFDQGRSSQGGLLTGHHTWGTDWCGAGSHPSRSGPPSLIFNDGICKEKWIWAPHKSNTCVTESSHFKIECTIFGLRQFTQAICKRCRRGNKIHDKQSYRSRDDPWPLWLWGGLDGHSAAVCPRSLEPLCWPGAGSHCAQTSPTSCGSV